MVPLAIAVVMVLTAKPAGASGAFVPGELLVKLKPGAVIEDALAPPGPGQAPRRAGTESGIPLRVLQQNSGGWLLLSVDRGRLPDWLADQLKDRLRLPGDWRAEGLHDRHPPGPARAHVEILLRGLGADGISKSRLEAFLADDLGLPAAVSPLGPRQFKIEIDLAELTLRVIARLRAHPDVDSAQPNFRVGSRSFP